MKWMMGLLVSSVLISQSWASIISINFATTGTTEGQPRQLQPGDVTGADVAATNNWNNLLLNEGVNKTWSGLVDAGGNSVSTTITTANWSGQVNMTIASTPFRRLYDTGLAKEGDVQSGNLRAATIAINDIPYTEYNVYLYYTHFPIGSDTLQTWTESNSNMTLYGTNNKGHGHDWNDFVWYATNDRDAAVAQAKTTDADGGGNWLVFEGLTGSSLTLTSTDQNYPDITGYKQRGIAGFQIVAIPEPATIGLLGMAAIGILARRRAMKA